MFELERIEAPESVADSVYNSLREAITSLSLRPGQTLIETEIARQLGVSVTPIREALRRLHENGLVALNRYRGATVAELTSRDVHEIYQLRILLEPFAVELSLDNLTENDFTALAHYLEQADEALQSGDLQMLSKSNRQFHGLFIERSQHSRLQRVLGNLQDMNRVIALMTWEGVGFDALEQYEHREILAAARDRDKDAASQKIKSHIERFSSVVEHAWANNIA